MAKPKRDRATEKSPGKSIEALRHDEDSRTNIPTAEYQPLVREEQQTPLQQAYQRRNRDLDPQLVWRGKDEQDMADMVVNVPPLYIQEKVQPKALIADLVRQSQDNRKSEEHQVDMFADFNGIPEGANRTEFYQHEGYWQNRLILGDSLQVMASLSQREGLEGKVQCIYIDPPYGIRFNSNFQWSTTSRDVRDGNREHITREPEQVKAFRDTWRDGIHSYLTYLRDRLTVTRDLLADSGSIFVQIGDENVHRVRALMDEVFGEENFVSLIAFTKTTGLGASHQLPGRFDLLLWYSRDARACKYRPLYEEQEEPALSGYTRHDPVYDDAGPYANADLTKPGPGQKYEISLFGRTFNSGGRWWGYPPDSISRAHRAGRLTTTQSMVYFKRFHRDFPLTVKNNLWIGLGGATDRTYVVQTNSRVIQYCILMATDPGDLVLDPTCGSGTTAYMAEQWGRRWITIDTSRVALALARARIMGARYPYYILADSREGQIKEAEVSRCEPSNMPTYGKLRQGFVYERVPHITLRDIANNSEIDVIWETAQEKLEPLREELNRILGTSWEEWEIPR